ncbi:MAG TPA: hypothetical protein VMP11_09155 [Verrucomicrobiae bacterium]|nr:hypothetical protein [Verrucomicrobiae bacterium]
MTLTSLAKAQAINDDFGKAATSGGATELGKINFRGAVAEIGAGQEVAGLFFEAFGSSRTIVKTMSAYGMGCSNAIYRVTDKFISEERLKRMFKHDYDLLLTRSLAEEEKPKNRQLRYFTFANTVDTDKGRQGWVGVRVQANGCSLSENTHTAFEYRLHFELFANDKPTKMRIVGDLGINLIYGALLNCSEGMSFVGTLSDEDFVAALMDNIDLANIRIDRITVEKYQITVAKSSRGKLSVVRKTLESSEQASRSRAMCIELIKNSTVHCATFAPSQVPAVPSYSEEMLADDNYLLWTRSACDVDALHLENEMLKCAAVAFARDLGHDPARNIDRAKIRTAIHLPILGIVPEERDQSGLYIYVSRELEPQANRGLRAELIRSARTEEIATRIDRIVKSKHIALISEFSASTELIKFLRSRTRLRKGNANGWNREIAFVLRADQLVELLINIATRVKDRHPLEMIGSIIRRGTRLYVYPCTYTRILAGKTRYGTEIRNALKPATLRKHGNNDRVGFAHLKDDLLEDYSSLIKCMITPDCIRDLHPRTSKFLDTPLRSQIEF